MRKKRAANPQNSKDIHQKDDERRIEERDTFRWIANHNGIVWLWNVLNSVYAMHGISSLYDHDAESQRYQNKRIPFENSKLKSCVRLNQVDPARIHGVLFVFVISFIVFIVFNFNGNARIHATDLIHWIAFSICKAISNICKTHKFSSVPVDAREPFNLIFELKP